MDQTGKVSEHTGGPEDGRVLVTGASGFVGGYVIRALLDRGYTPVCLVRDPGKLTGRLADEQAAKLEIVQGDPFDLAALHRAAAGCRAAIHLIGIIEEKPSIGQTFSRVHVEATRNVVQVCT